MQLAVLSGHLNFKLYYVLYTKEEKPFSFCHIMSLQGIRIFPVLALNFCDPGLLPW
jgi:hypothetical protein